MKTHITLSQAFSSEAMTKRVFSWLSRIGAAPKFGSRPIENPCCRGGVITDKVIVSKSITPSELFNQADALSRK